jgi:hypothetical protein
MHRENENCSTGVKNLIYRAIECAEGHFERLGGEALRRLKEVTWRVFGSATAGS